MKSSQSCERNEWLEKVLKSKFEFSAVSIFKRQSPSQGAGVWVERKTNDSKFLFNFRPETRKNGAIKNKRRKYIFSYANFQTNKLAFVSSIMN